MYPFPNFEPVCCSMSDFNCCFLTCIQVSQEAGKVVWYSHLLKNFPQFVVCLYVCMCYLYAFFLKLVNLPTISLLNLQHLSFGFNDVQDVCCQ